MYAKHSINFSNSRGTLLMVILLIIKMSHRESNDVLKSSVGGFVS